MLCHKVLFPYLMTKFLLLLKIFGAWLALFLVGKLLFFAYNGFPALTDLMHIIGHGLSLDLSVASYATAPIWLATWVGVFWDTPLSARIGRWLFRGYTTALLTLFLLIIIIDTIIYKSWGFKLDAVALSYLDNPSSIPESLGWGFVLLAFVAFVAIVAGLSWCFWRILPQTAPTVSTKGEVTTAAAPHHAAPRSCTLASIGTYLLRRLPISLGWALLGGLLFLSIRGGVGRSTANVGMVYYSTVQYHNHAAVNPVFSFFYSLLKEQDYSKQAQYFSHEEADRIFASLQYNTKSVILPEDSLLTTRRPNVLLILMESCGGRVVGCTEGNHQTTPHLDSLAAQGVFFSRCYANSFRTDRGTICTFSGYPSFPDASVMKMPAKSRVLPSIAGALKGVGYDTEFLYGGDKNFTNMNSYFLATGYNRVLGDVDFPASLRHTSPWGVCDGEMMKILLGNIKASEQKGGPWFKTLLTLSSHEPWDVPYQRLNDKMLNAFAYLDHSIGEFIAAFRQTPAWKNTLIVILPDHGVTWPADINEYDIRKYHIPLIWTGGAVREPRVVSKICNQTDVAATLLGQLGIDHSAFHFSRDVLSQTYTYPLAIHTWPEGYTFIDSTGTTIYDLNSQSVSKVTPDPKGDRLRKVKAFMQKAYRHMDALR